MPRVKRSVGARKKRRKVLEQARAYWGLNSSNYTYAKEQVEHSLINAGARLHGLYYSQLISGLKAANVELDRKVLADLAVSDPEQFGKLAQQAKDALPA